MLATCLIIYSSMTGNTKEIAEEIGKGIVEAGADVEIKDILLSDVTDLFAYDGILLGAHTWGDGELPDEFLDFYEEMDGIRLDGKAAAAFGSCDSSYEYRGRAVDLLEAKLAERGAEIIAEGLKIELAPTKAEKQQCIQFGKEFVKKIIEKAGKQNDENPIACK